MKKGILALTLGVGLTLFGNSTFAAENSDAIAININSSPSTIELNWDDKGAFYQLYEGELKVWEGTENKVVLENLLNDNQYKYTLRLFDENNNLIDEVLIRTQTKKGFVANKQNASRSLYNLENSNSTDKEKLNSISPSSILNDDKVIISWDGDIPDDDGIYEVYRDKEKIGTTTDNKIIDETLKPDSTYVYEIVGNKRLSDEKVQLIRSELEKSGIEVSAEQEKELFYDTYSLTRTIKTEPTNKMRSVAQTYAIQQRYIVRYATFIPMDYALNPFRSIADTQYFNGNDRDFNAFSTSFKTRMDVNINFPTSGIATATLPNANKKVGRTFYYDKNYKTIGDATASNSGMNIRDVVGTTSKVSYNAYHDIGIPYLNFMTPDITWSYNATIYRDGGYNVSGSHDKAPSHEMYIMIPNSDMYGEIHTKDHVDFKYLAPIYPNYSINSSY